MGLGGPPTWAQQVLGWCRATGASSFERTVVWVPTLAARRAVLRAFAAAGMVGLVPRVVVPMGDPVAMQEFGVSRELWADEKDIWAARQVVGAALARADAGLGGSVLAGQAQGILDVLRDLALAGKTRGDLWRSVPENLAQHFLDAADVLRVAVEDYDAWVVRGGVDVAGLAAARWQQLARLQGWRQAVVPLGWQDAAVLAWIESVRSGDGNLVAEVRGGERAVTRVLAETMTPAEEARLVRHMAEEAVREGQTPVAIAVGDAALGTLIAAELAAAGLTPKGGWGRTAAEGLLGRLVVTLMGIAARGDGLAYAGMGAALLALRPGCLEGVSLLEERVWRGMGARDGRGWARLLQRLEMPAGQEDLKEALLASGVFTAPEKASLKAWRDWLVTALEALLGDWRAADEGGSVEKILILWGEVGARWLVPAGVAEAWLRGALDSVTLAGKVPAEAPVLTGRLAGLAGAKTLIVAGMNAAQWVPVRPHPWLSERQLLRLAIPGQRAAELLAAEEWRLLWDGAGAERVVVTRSLHGFDGAAAMPASPWLEILETSDKDILAEWRAAGAVYAGWQAARGAVIRNDSPAALPVAAIEAWSPSLVEDALACPYRAAVGRRAKVRPWDEFAALPDARALGLLLHGVIEAFWSGWGHDVVVPEMARAAEARLGEVAEAALGREEASLVRLWRPRVAALVPELVKTWVRDGAAGWRMAGVEHVLEGVVGGVPIKATADHVDAEPGGLRVVDYKTGSVPQDKEIATGAKPQLVLEGAILAAAGKAVAGLAYVRLKGYGRRKVEFKNVDDVAEAMGAAPDGMARLDASLRGQPWVAVPDLSKGGLEAAGHCKHCAFAGWCRFEERVREARV